MEEFMNVYLKDECNRVIFLLWDKIFSDRLNIDL